MAKSSITSLKDPSSERYLTLATQQELAFDHWIELTGMGAGSAAASLFKISSAGVRATASGADDEFVLAGMSNEEQAPYSRAKSLSLDFPCSPAVLVDFVNQVESLYGRVFSVPDEFRNCVEKLQGSPFVKYESGIPKHKLPAGVTTKQIKDGFRLNDAWGEKLRHLDRYPFLKKAVMVRGSRQNGKHRSHQWNPALFAEILLKKKVKRSKAVDTVINSHFAEWFDEWERLQSIDQTDSWEET